MRKLIGHIGVDSGQIMITDPCYLGDWEDNDFTSSAQSDGEYKPTHKYSYDGACTTTLGNDGHGELYFRMGHPGAAVVSRTAYGDGTYPVYAEYINGVLKGIFVDFDPSEEDV